MFGSVLRVQNFAHRPTQIIGTAKQWLTAKKEAHAEAPFRQGHRSVPDSHTERLQLLVHEAISVATLRFDGPAHAWMLTDQLISHHTQSAL
jgi:hypothetical protein